MIYRTNDYSKFKTLKGNRKTRKQHVIQLANELRRNNLLESCPIIVNENFEIIDGQHRLAAAKKIDAPVYYTKVKGAGIRDVIALNRSQQRWTTWDYIELYIADKRDQYRLLKDFCATYELPPSSAMVLLSQHSKFGKNGTATEAFRSGEFEIESYEYAEELADFMNMLKPYMRIGSIYRNVSFVAAIKRAARLLANDYNESLELLVQSYKETNMIINAAERVGDFITQFEEVIRKSTGRKSIVLQ